MAPEIDFVSGNGAAASFLALPGSVNRLPCAPMRLLVVEDDVALRQAVCASASNWTIVVREHDVARNARFTHVAQAGSLKEAVVQLEADFDLVVVDIRLGQQSGIEVVEHIKRSGRAPAILAVSGQATAGEAFQLAVLGVRGYLAKPFDMRELRAGIQAMFDEPPDLGPGAMAQVGRRHIHVVQDEVKRAMLKRALQWEHGNISRAARRLGVTRTAVQQMIDRYGLTRPSESPDNTDEEQGG